MSNSSGVRQVIWVLVPDQMDYRIRTRTSDQIYGAMRQIYYQDQVSEQIRNKISKQIQVNDEC